MNKPDRSRKGWRGKPMVALLAVLAGWGLVRVATWQLPPAMHELTRQADTPLAVDEAAIAPQSGLVSQSARSPAAPDNRFVNMPWMAAPQPPAMLAPMPAPMPAHVPDPVMDRPNYWGDVSPGGDIARPTGPAAPRAPARHIVGHNMMLMAGLAQMEVAPSLLPYIHGASPSAAPSAAPQVRQPSPVFAPAAAQRFAAEAAPASASQPSRWSMDAWAMWREDDTSPLLSGRPSYGRSQIGAVLRFALAPSSGHAPQTYVRASAALAGAREDEAALGLSARPVPALPVRIAAEARFRETAAGRDARAAAYGVSEFPPLALPLETTAEAYVQAGYVTGRVATGFVDGQARITRELAEVDNFRLNAGGGAWGGAQEGSSRLDIGPSAAITFGAGGVNARVSADYRFRVAGDAEPSSGPTLTISAGF